MGVVEGMYVLANVNPGEEGGGMWEGGGLLRT